jgi:hypothetical protein
VKIYLKGQKTKYGGMFKHELDAATKLNQLCKESGISEKNPGINKIPVPNKTLNTKEKISQYKGISWHKREKKWFVVLRSKDGNRKYGGSFRDELDAAKRVNQFCEELEIPIKNPEIGTIPHRQWKHNYHQTIDFEQTNTVMDSEIAKTDNSDGKSIKNKFPFKQCYFYDDMLK